MASRTTAGCEKRHGISRLPLLPGWSSRTRHRRVLPQRKYVEELNSSHTTVMLALPFLKQPLQVDLVAEGVDTVADIFVNRHWAARTENSHRQVPARQSAPCMQQGLHRVGGCCAAMYSAQTHPQLAKPAPHSVMRAGARLAREQRVPVKPFLVPGNNTLTFRISPAVEAAQLRAAAYPYPVPSLCEPPAVPCTPAPEAWRSAEAAPLEDSRRR